MGILLDADRPSLARRPHVSTRRDPTDPRRHVDWSLVIVPLLITALGFVAIYSARKTALETAGGDTLYYVKRQALAVVGGLIAMVAIAAIDYRKLRDSVAVFYAGVILLLVAVVSPLGSSVNGAQAWFQLGAFQFQPSEFAKIVLILTLAAYASLGKGELSAYRLGISMAVALVPAALVMFQPDLGTTLVLLAITMGTLMVAGARLRHIIVISLLGLVTIVVIFESDTLARYQEARLTAPFATASSDGEEDAFLAQTRFHQEQSETAIGNGGITGQGLFNGPQTRAGLVPEQQTDFIFTVVGEELGFAGAGGLLGLYAILALRFWRTARLSKDLTGALICAGALAMLAFQVFENVGMTMGIMPIAGIPLPLMSYGGSSTLAFFCLLGLVQSVHMRRYA